MLSNDCFNIFSAEPVLALPRDHLDQRLLGVEPMETRLRSQSELVTREGLGLHEDLVSSASWTVEGAHQKMQVHSQRVHNCHFRHVASHDLRHVFSAVFIWVTHGCTGLTSGKCPSTPSFCHLTSSSFTYPAVFLGWRPNEFPQRYTLIEPGIRVTAVSGVVGKWNCSRNSPS